MKCGEHFLIKKRKSTRRERRKSLGGLIEKILVHCVTVKHLSSFFREILDLSLTEANIGY